MPRFLIAALAELTAVADAFRGLAPDQRRRPAPLVPVDPELPRWTVFELAGHFDIAIGLTLWVPITLSYALTWCLVLDEGRSD